MITEIRKRHPGQLILIISAYDFSDALYPANPHGANAYIPKPIDYETLVTKLISLCQEAKATLPATRAHKKSESTLEQRVARSEAAVDAIIRRLEQKSKLCGDIVCFLCYNFSDR
ncbi:MAG: hypothetical protein K6347_02260 [Campylobacterales bacterium]